MTLQETSSGPGVQSEALVFLSFFADLPDPRQAGKIIYPLPEVLLLCLLAVLAGAECFVEIARFGERKIELLRRFLPFKDGTPSHDQLCDIFAMIDATHFQRCFVAWVSKMLGGQMWSPSTARRHADPPTEGEERPRSIWCPHSRPASTASRLKSRTSGSG